MPELDILIHLDPPTSIESIRKIERLAEVVIPGHDRSFRLEQGQAYYLEELKAEIYVKTSPIAGETLTFTIRAR